MTAARTASPSTSPVEAFTPGGHVAGDDRRVRLVDRRDRAGHRLARRALEAGAEHGVDHAARAPPAPPASNGRGGSPGSRSRLAAASPRSSRGVAERQHVDLAALLAQQPRHHQPVAAVVALADHHPNRPWPRGRRGHPRQARCPRAPSGRARARPPSRSRTRRPPASPRPRTAGRASRAALMRRSGRRSPPRRRSSPVWVSETLTSAPSSRARRSAAPARRSSGAAAGRHDLDLAECPALEAERLGHGLLGAEARRQVLARARPLARRRRSSPLA